MARFPFILLALVGLVTAQYDSGYGGGYGSPAPSPDVEPQAQPQAQTQPAGTGSSPVTSSSPITTSSPSVKSSSSSSANNATGDVQCGEVMCIGATVQGNQIQYVMQSTGSQRPGWMGMGFGTGMVGSPMVIMWTNSDNSVSLSQREASDHVLPSVVPNPARVAQPNTDISTSLGAEPIFAFTIPADSNNSPSLIYAFGTDVPSSADPNTATFNQHVAFGYFTFDLTKSFNSTILAAPSLSLLPGGGGAVSSSIKQTTTEKVILAHAIVCSIAFLVIMPTGALLARYYRTFSPLWFKGHWILQFGISAPVVLTGAALAFAIKSAGGPRTWDTHAQVGILLFGLYIAQCLLGGVIHFVKPKKSKGRPVQNYAHAILGITIIGVAFYQVRLGYTREWPNATGRPAPGGINVLWYIWAVFIPLAYTSGLALLKKQFTQERESRMNWEKPIPIEYKMGYTV